MTTTIHPTAVVDPGAQLGQGVHVGPFCIVEKDTVLGDNTWLDAYVQIKAGTSMGSGNKVYAHTCIGGEPQHLTFSSEGCRVEIGNNNLIREFITIHRGTKESGGVTRIGSGCMLMAYVHIAHDCILSDTIMLANATMLGGHVHIEHGAILGGQSGVHQFVRIGRHSFLGGKGGLPQDLPPYMLAQGCRGTLRGPNLVGLRRLGLPKETISAMKAAYKTIWRSGLPRQEALEQIDTEYGHIEQIKTLLNFIRSTERGILSGPSDASSCD